MCAWRQHIACVEHVSGYDKVCGLVHEWSTRNGDKAVVCPSDASEGTPPGRALLGRLAEVAHVYAAELLAVWRPKAE